MIETNKSIYFVHCNSNYILNDWQLSVYEEYDANILKMHKNNEVYVKKINELYGDKIKIISFVELKKIFEMG
jgi:hypothetical protein